MGREALKRVKFGDSPATTLEMPGEATKDEGGDVAAETSRGSAFGFNVARCLRAA